jgi:hypothetical protein
MSHPVIRKLFAVTTVACGGLAVGVATFGQIGQLKQKAKGQAVPSARPLSSLPTARTVQVDLELFDAVVSEELIIAGNGDEPYMAVKTYWIDGNTVNLNELSKATFRAQGRNGARGNLGRKGIKGEGFLGIPKDLGQFEDTLTPIARTASAPNGAPAMVVVAAVGMEEDFSPPAAIRQFLGDGFRRLDEEILRMIRNRSGADPKVLEDALKGFLKGRWMSARNLNILGTVDPDDFIGSDVEVFTLPEIEAAGSRGLDLRLRMSHKTPLYLATGRVRIKSTPTPPQNLVLTIKQVRAVDDLEGLGRGDPDFQMRVVMDGQVFMSPESSGKTIRPNWTFQVPIVKPEVSIVLELFERDSGSPDELCDIGPMQYSKTLALRYLVDKNLVTGDRRGQGGVEIVSTGKGDSDKAEVAFTLAPSR